MKMMMVTSEISGFRMGMGEMSNLPKTKTLSLRVKDRHTVFRTHDNRYKMFRF